jgi:hypothetical protein
LEFNYFRIKEIKYDNRKRNRAKIFRYTFKSSNKFEMENELEKSGFDKRLSDELPEGVK